MGSYEWTISMAPDDTSFYTYLIICSILVCAVILFILPIIILLLNNETNEHLDRKIHVDSVPWHLQKEICDEYAKKQKEKKKKQEKAKHKLKKATQVAK